MGRFLVAFVILLLPVLGQIQSQVEQQFDEAGVCS